MASQFDFWREALRLKAEGKPYTLHEGDVHSGYWRKLRSKSERVWQAVGIWREGGELIVQVDGKPYRGHLFPAELFTHVVREPISYAVYKAVIEEGKPWLDMPPEIVPAPERKDAPRQRAAPTPFDVADFEEQTGVAGGKARMESVPAADRDVMRSDNEPKPEDNADPYVLQIRMLAEEKQLVEKFLKQPITTQADADRASNWADRVAKLKKWLTDEHKREKAPILEAGKALDTKYLRPADEAQALVRSLTEHQGPFLAAELKRRQAEAVKEAEAERAAAPPPLDSALLPDAPAEPPAPKPVAPVRSGGATGRKTTLATERYAEVTDYAVLARFLITGGHEGAARNDCANVELKTLLDRLANKMAAVAVPEQMQPGFTTRDRPKMRR